MSAQQWLIPPPPLMRCTVVTISWWTGFTINREEFSNLFEAELEAIRGSIVGGTAYIMRGREMMLFRNGKAENHD